MKLFFLGLLQGLTEFLPVSSSGHLFLLKRILGLNANLLPFFVFLHFATVIAILVFIGQELPIILRQKKVVAHLAVITLITGGIAFFINLFLNRFFESKYLIAGGFFINAFILLRIKKSANNRTMQEMNRKDSVILGLWQSVALFPGISRSGITISTLIRRGFTPKDAFVLSFSMAIPIILIATGVEFGDLLKMRFPFSDLCIGFMVTFLSGMLALSILRKMLVNFSFKGFAYYSFVMAILTGVL